MKIAMVYASENGSSAEVAEFMAGRIRDGGLAVDAINANNNDVSINAYDVVILGAPIYKGLWHRDMLRFLIEQHSILAEKRILAWLTCVRILEEDGLEHVQKHYLSEEIKRLRLVQPVGIFAGKLTYQDLAEEDRWTFYLRYDGNARMKEMDGDFRDWKAISQWIDDAMMKLVSEGNNEA